MHKPVAWIWMYSVCLALELKVQARLQKYPYRNVTSPTPKPSSTDEVASSTVSTQWIVETTKYMTTQLRTANVPEITAPAITVPEMTVPEITAPGVITSLWDELTATEWTSAGPSDTLDTAPTSSRVLSTIFGSHTKSSFGLPITVPGVITSIWDVQPSSAVTGSPEALGTIPISSPSPSAVLENTLSTPSSTMASVSTEDTNMLNSTEAASGLASAAFASSNKVQTSTVAATNGMDRLGFPSAAASKSHSSPDKESFIALVTQPPMTSSKDSFSVTGSRSPASQSTPPTTRTAKSLLTDSVTLSLSGAQTETGLPSGAPAEILPDVAHVSQSPNLATLYVGFQFPLNYAFLVSNRLAALQIFELLPRTLLKVHSERAAIVKLLPYHAEEAHSFVKTLAMVACTEPLAEQLLQEIQVPNSALYMQGDELSRNLASLIDSGISTRHFSATGCEASSCRPDTKAAKGGGGGLNKAATVGMIIGGASLSGAIGVAAFCTIRRKTKRRRRALSETMSNRGQAWRHYNRIESTQPSMRQFDRRNISRPITSLNSLGIHGPG